MTPDADEKMIKGERQCVVVLTCGKSHGILYESYLKRRKKNHVT